MATQFPFIQKLYEMKKKVRIIPRLLDQKIGTPLHKLHQTPNFIPLLLCIWPF